MRSGPVLGRRPRSWFQRAALGLGLSGRTRRPRQGPLQQRHSRRAASAARCPGADGRGPSRSRDARAGCRAPGFRTSGPPRCRPPRQGEPSGERPFPRASLCPVPLAPRLAAAERSASSPAASPRVPEAAGSSPSLLPQAEQPQRPQPLLSLGARLTRRHLPC